MKHRVGLNVSLLGLLLSLVLICSSKGSQSMPAEDSQNHTNGKPNVVYVCACLRTKSCFCMTEAKMQGPWACGTQGGPPIKAVPPESDWAKQNREALAK